MSNVEDYNMKVEVIKAIPDDQIKVPNSIPVKIYIHEAECLYAWCQDDKEELTINGLDWTLVEDLPFRCGALRVAESNWRQVRLLREEAEKIWVLESPTGYDLRNELVHHFRYAFRDDSSLILSVKDISKRLTHSGMLKGLKDLSELGKANRDLLTNIGFDFTLLDMAVIKAALLTAKYEAASVDRKDYREAKKIRNQAFTHLKQAVDLIRQCGQYVFWRKAVRVKGYRSNYLRKVRLRNLARKNKRGTGKKSVKIAA